MKYSVNIVWSAEDNTFLASSPTHESWISHGATHEEALANLKKCINQNTQDIIDFINDGVKRGSLVASIDEDGEILINNSEPYNCGVDIRLRNEGGYSGRWCVECE